MQLDLTPVVTASKKITARVPQSRVLVEVNTSQAISCESQSDEPLSSCLWGRSINGQRQVITVDEHVVEDGGRTEVEGITYDGNGLENGTCSIKIASVSADDVGTWSCTLVSHNGPVFTGIVEITTEGIHTANYLKLPMSFFRTESTLICHYYNNHFCISEVEPTIYFGAGGLMAYSVATSQTTTIVSDGTSTYGVAYDSLRDRIYWSTSSTIKRCDRDGNNVETVLTSSTCMTFCR